MVTAMISSVVAAAIMSYVANVAKPGVLHVVLALMAVGATVSAFLFIARSKVDALWKAGTVVALGAIGAIYLILLSTLH